METGASPAVPVSVRKLQTTLHAKAKQDPGFRFSTLSDKVWREGLQTGAYRPQAVRQVPMPKKQAGRTRPLGIPCVPDRVAQTAAALVLVPIFEADLQPEQYAYRTGRSPLDAVRRVHRLLNLGRREVVDADLSNSCGEIPPAELLRSLARRISDGRLLGWLKA